MDFVFIRFFIFHTSASQTFNILEYSAVADGRGYASPVNPKAFPVFLEYGTGADIDMNIHAEKTQVK